MKKCLTLLLLLPLFISNLIAQDFQPDFRKVQWGNKLSEVLKIETDSLVEQTDTKLVYSTDVGGVKAELKYNFNQKLLTDALYLFNIEDSTNIGYVDFYKKLSEHLNHKYGEAAENDFEVSADKLAFAKSIGEGKSTYSTVWQTERTRIALKINGFSGNVYLFLMYMAKAHVLDLMPKYDEQILNDL